MTIDPNKLAFENCCKEVYLRKEANRYSNLKINSSNKKVGEMACEFDEIFINCVENEDF